MLYVDANATYPVAAAHYDRVAALLKDIDGNPSSIHSRGRGAKIALEEARTRLGRLLGARAGEIIFTSGATEANNFAIQGVVASAAQRGSLPHIVVGANEHASVLETAKILAARAACLVSLAPVLRSGEVDAEALVALIRDDTVLVCVMHANNETGAINPVADIATRIKAKSPKVHLHVDAVQMLGKADLSWYGASKIDSAAFTGHKLGAFKGIGALFLKSGLKLQLQLTGGGQERGRRPGTENMPGIVSFGIRCDEVRGKETQIALRMQSRKEQWAGILAKLAGAVIHDGAADSLPNTVNFHIDKVPGDDILLNFDLAGIQASSGSACSSGVARPSPTLLAMGYSEWVALNSVRVSFAAEGDVADDIARMGQVLREVVERVRR